LNVYSVRFERGKEIDAGKVMVLQEQGDPVELDGCTEICKRAEAKLRQMNIDVYAPLRRGALYTPEDLAKIRRYVMQVLKGYVKNGGSENVLA
jgi:hypothetical protein